MYQNRLKQLLHLAMLLAAIVGCSVGFAQTPVKGRVIDSFGQPVIGASVIVDGTTRGVTTDLNGDFVLNEASGTTITVSYIGCTPVQIALSNGMVITLTEDATAIDDVVVVGYGVQKKETLTGAIAVVGDEMLKEKGSLSSPLQAMQGQVPGVIITRSSSAPGDESWSMNLRGSVSRNTAAPLIIVDGIALDSTNEMRNLNPQDIATMSFLKDGAAAIYGSRAAGGVVLITTKKGAEGQARVEYSGSFSIKTVGLMPELMTIDEWADSVLTALANDGKTSDNWITYAQLAKAYKGSYIDLQTSPNPFAAGFTDVADIVFDDTTNWLGSLFDTAYSTTHDVSVTGGSDKINYRVSLGYLYDGSNIQFGNNQNERYNFRINNSFKITDWLKLESVIGYNRQEQVAPTQVGAILTVNMPMPGLPLMSQNGLPYAWGTWGSPAAKAEYGGDNKLSVTGITISETFNANLTKWLDMSLNMGYSNSYAIRDTQSKSIEYYNYAGNTKVRTEPIADDSYYKKTTARTDFYTFTGYLTGHHTFADDHNVKVMLGGQYEFKDFMQYGAEAKNIQPDFENINGAGVVELKDTNKYQHAILSMMGRANYDYKSRYLIEFNMRYDGSSKFLPENRWAFFWGGSLGWRISEESFLRDSKWVDELKLRLSYGEVGNQGGISNYDGVSLFSLNAQAGAMLGSSQASYLSISKLASTSRSWERIKNYNIGLDFGLFGNRLSGMVEAFLKKNDNMLAPVTYPGVLGITAPDMNAGKFEAWGYEGQLTWRDKIGEDFNYFVGGTFTFARSELVNYGGTVTMSSGYTSSREGYPLNALFGLRYGGKIENEEMLEAYKAKFYENNEIGIPSNLRVGDNMYCDVNGDGKLNAEDYVYLGTDNPEIQYSLTAGFSWKGIDVSVVFQGAANRTMWNGINQWTVPMRANYTNTTNQSIGNVWSPENPGGHYNPYTNDSNINNYNYQASSHSASDASYIRLKNLSVGYTLPEKWFAKTKSISGCRIYFTGSDLWEHSNILDGWDPEAKSNPSSTARYPFVRTFTFGANLTF